MEFLLILLAEYGPLICAILAEVGVAAGIFAKVKSILEFFKAHKIADEDKIDTLTTKLDVLTSQNAELRAMNSKLLVQLTKIQPPKGE